MTKKSPRLDEHPLAERFHLLTPDEVLDAAEVGGRVCTGRVMPLNSYENRVYQFEMEDGPSIIGKFYRPGRWSRAAIAAEHEFIADLVDADVPVAAPFELSSGETIGEVFGIYYALFPQIRGRSPEEFDDDELRELGDLLAQLHDVGDERDAPDRPVIEPATYGSDNLDYLLAHDILPTEVRDIYAATVEALLDRMESWFDDVDMHRIHGDCHRANLIATPDGPVFVDFDDFRIGPAVQDIWMLVPSYDAEGDRQREVLIEGYRDVRDFDRDEMRLIEPLRALRYVHYATWIARRWADGAFRRVFGHFGTLRYWQNEVADLREQIARIDYFRAG